MAPRLFTGNRAGKLKPPEAGWRVAAVPARRIPHAGQILLLAALYFAAARLSLHFAIPPGYASAIWPASGIALAAVLLLGLRVWPGIWLGAALANLMVAASPAAALLIATGNTLEAVVGGMLIQRTLGVPRRFDQGEDVVRFVALSALTCMLAATVAVITLGIEGSVIQQDVLAHWWTWWQGDVTGIIVVTPLILTWSARRRAPWPARKQLEAAAFSILLLIATLLVFGDAVEMESPFPLSFAIFPFMIWAALRFSQRMVATANAAVCAVAIGYTLRGSGPFALPSLNESMLILLAFISTLVVTGLVLSAVMVERNGVMGRLARAIADLREQAVTDPLTGLYNRRYLWQFLHREWATAQRRQTTLAMIMIDLDHFKHVNDAQGHDAGDFVLVSIARLLESHTRSGDIVSRFGGEEFALVLPDVTLESAQRRAEQIRIAIRRLELVYRGRPVGMITASLGVALLPGHADDPEALLRAADRTLYDAKLTGRDRVVTCPLRFSRQEPPEDAGRAAEKNVTDSTPPHHGRQEGDVG